MSNTKNCRLAVLLIKLGTITQLGILTDVPVLAQITPDTTLGNEKSVFTSEVNADLITGGATRGSSLFHSFSEFNVNNGQRVYFDNPANITNILSRVTGSNASNILGTLGVNGTANLYLLNPKGIIFGKDAKLDIQGAFFATTANSFKFADGSEFSATNPQPPLLIMSVPVGVQFGSQPKDISSEADLVVGKDLTLSGGNLNLKELRVGQNISLQAHEDIITGNLKSSVSGNGGKIYVNGHGNFIPKGNVDSSTVSNYPGGDITILVSGNMILDGYKVISNTNGSGNGGNIDIKARSLDLKNGGQITSVSGPGATGNSGNITINVSDTISLTSNITSTASNNTGSAIFTLADRAYPDSQIANSSKGNGGNISIITGNLKLQNGSEILANNFGNNPGTKAGDIRIYARDTITLDGYRNNNDSYSSSSIASNIRWGAEGGSKGAKQAGNIYIEAANLKILNGGSISSKAEKQEIGNAGNITINIINTEGSVLIRGSGGSGNKQIPSGIFNTLESGALGNGGFIKIKTGEFSLTEGARIDSSLAGTGNSVGDITIEADNILLQGLLNQEIKNNTGIFTVIEQGGKLNSETDTGTGSIALTTGKLIIKDNATLSADTYGKGNAGNVTVNAKKIDLNNGGQIISVVREKAQGNGGNIIVKTDNLTGINKGLISSAVMTGGNGNGGFINIKTGELSLTDGARIDSSLAGTGNSVGDITIEAENIFLQGLPNQDINNYTGIFTVINPEGKLSSETGTGSIALTTGKLIINDNATLSADTYGKGNAGNMTVNAKEMDLNNGGQIISVVRENAQGNGGNIIVTTDNLAAINKGLVSVSSRGTGNAGNITIKAIDALTLQTQGRISSSVTGKGNAGNIQINSPYINLNSNGIIEVDSQNTDLKSSAGNITFSTNFLKLDNASITAKNTSGNGGTIDIETQNLLLRNDSEISTTAGSPSQPGNGGKISINAKNGYVIAVPKENSDIIANAFGGNGGSIDISAIRVLGLATRGKLNTAELQGIRNNGTSDISASSDIGTDGNVIIQTIGIDPSQGLVATPVNLIDPSKLIAQGCNSNNSNVADNQSEFIITGKGGIPISPDDSLTVGELPATWATRERSNTAIVPTQIAPPPAPLVEAQGMIRNANGDIVLVAKPVISNGFQSGLFSKLCGIAQK